jgi:cbb3-type cytochrome oxidase maturation protein
MAMMFVLLPVALAFAAGALAVFLWAARTGQFDDLDTPPLRILVEDDLDPRFVAKPLHFGVAECAAGAPSEDNAVDLWRNEQ